MKLTHFLYTSVCIALLTGCSLGGLAGPFPGANSPGGDSSAKTKYPPAPPQTMYRIDENRYFEVKPFDQGACAYADLVYVDQLQKIRSTVSSWRGYYGPNQSEVNPKFIIDAANTDYLVAPILDSRGDCGADTANRPSCSARLPYSTDGGRSWKFTPTIRDGKAILVGSKVFLGKNDVGTLDISSDPIERSDWKYLSSTKFSIPSPRKAPLDTKFHCTPNGKE